ncbi:hypothetical protein [Chitinophaga sancti]|uniref:Uncharacterized protein n=1 Tax=Chitinophaga sancti TaxID=1004 RepID=A0A1K1SGS6_9BACT|nr:hypothetical protein [Chitinophaga sancti]WQD59820.1 hypothetical protein U0033_18180 [Chitinophaga sancti]WQG88049.1 hypothetical protein SR876_24285 [Chitinophaga sancti]SFW83109.1 hypothetical protein SAMN05661012_05343 [Chitinophaga sancti]
MKNCRLTSTNKIFTFEEQKSKLILKNIDEVESIKIHVDGCEITEGLRCDYLHLAKGIEFFIELKGQDLLHAVKQLKQTITKLGSKNKKQERTCYIICTRSPLASTQIQTIDREFRKDYNSKLVVKSAPYTDSY